MNILQNIEESLKYIWKPVLNPLRRPICNDQLGTNYTYSNDGNFFKRLDGTLRTFDNFEITFTCYLRIKDIEKVLQKKKVNSQNKSESHAQEILKIESDEGIEIDKTVLIFRN
jgi:hypothetical protein